MRLVVSAATDWEIATKWRLGKLPHARAVVENDSMALHRLAAVDLPISGALARQVGLWPGAGEHGSGVCPVRRGDDVAISLGVRGIRGCPASEMEFHPRLRRMGRPRGATGCQLLMAAPPIREKQPGAMASAPRHRGVAVAIAFAAQHRPSPWSWCAQRQPPSSLNRLNGWPSPWEATWATVAPPWSRRWKPSTAARAFG